MRTAFFFVPLLAVNLLADDNLAARRLYYQDNAPEVVFKATTVAQKSTDTKPAVVKPMTVAAAQQKPAVTVASVSKAQQIEKIQQALRAAASATALTPNSPVLKPAANLGVRYNILKVNLETSVRTEVPPDTVFHEKDCVAVRIQPNRGGFLYVFAEESSGRFRALIPSEEAAEDSNVVRAYNLMDVPQNYCFEMDDKPGTERLLLVVTDKPEDVMKLNDSLRKNAEGNVAVAQNDMKPFTAALQGARPQNHPRRQQAGGWRSPLFHLSGELGRHHCRPSGA